MPCTRKQLCLQSTLQPSIVSVVSRSLGTPLCIISTKDSPPQVTAALSLSELNSIVTYNNFLIINPYTDEGVQKSYAHLVTWSSNSQGDHFFSADNNNFHLAVNRMYNIVALQGDKVCTCCYYC